VLSDVSHTLRNERRDFPEWHRGRSPYVFWAIELDRTEVRARVKVLQQQLGDLLLAGYVRQPHVTLDVCGFPARVPADGEEFAPALLEAQLGALRGRAPMPFEIEIGGTGSFASAPYLVVADCHGGIAALRDCLAVDGRHRLSGPYVPHVTIGLYGDASPAPMVRRRLEACVPGAPLRCPVMRLALMSYRPGEIGGRLDCLGRFELAGRAMGWAGGVQCALDFAGA